jgi:hypothetical protein
MNYKIRVCGSKRSWRYLRCWSGKPRNSESALIGQRCEPKTSRIRSRSGTQSTATFCYNHYHPGKYFTGFEPCFHDEKSAFEPPEQTAEVWCSIQKKTEFSFSCLGRISAQQVEANSGGRTQTWSLLAPHGNGLANTVFTQLERTGYTSYWRNEV